jgi:hypothetical protein
VAAVGSFFLHGAWEVCDQIVHNAQHHTLRQAFLVAHEAVAVCEEVLPASLLEFLYQQNAQRLSSFSYHRPSLGVILHEIAYPMCLFHDEVGRWAGHALLSAAVLDEGVQR